MRERLVPGDRRFPLVASGEGVPYRSPQVAPATRPTAGAVSVARSRTPEDAPDASVLSHLREGWGLQTAPR